MSWEVKTDKASESEHGPWGSNGKREKYLPRVKFLVLFWAQKLIHWSYFFQKCSAPDMEQNITKSTLHIILYHKFVNQLITPGYFSGSVSVRFYLSQSMLLYLIFGVFLPPANEVCEGYVFTPVCQSFWSWGGVCSSA